MDATWLKLAMMAIGAISLYMGYRLFCDAPQANEQRLRSFDVRKAVLRNFVAGALLAMLGLGILFTEARAFAAQSHEAHRGWNRNHPAEQGSFETTPRLRRETAVRHIA
jgi:hypothetical protein